jgi:hypothetical protein
MDVDLAAADRAPDGGSRGPEAGTVPDREREGDGEVRRGPLPGRRRSGRASLPPLPGSPGLRIGLSATVAAIALCSLASAVLVMLMWWRDGASALVASQVDRVYDVVDQLAAVERALAVVAVALASAWSALGLWNACRAGGVARWPVLLAVTPVLGAFAVWRIGAALVVPDDSIGSQALGLTLQGIVVLVVLQGFDQVATRIHASRNGLRATALATYLAVAHLQLFGGLSRLERSTESSDWWTDGVTLVAGALLLVLAAIAVNEACRAFEDASDRLYDKRIRVTGEDRERQGRRARRAATA